MTYATKFTSVTKSAQPAKATLGYCANLALAARIALGVLGFGASSAWAHDAEVEPIVGLWLITASYGTTVLDNVFTGWTSDGLEFGEGQATQSTEQAAQLFTMTASTPGAVKVWI